MFRVAFSIRSMFVVIAAFAIAVWLMSDTTLSVSATMEFWELELIEPDSVIGIFPADESFESHKTITCQFCGYDPEQEKLAVKMPRWSSLRVQLAKDYDTTIFRTNDSEWIASGDWFQVMD